MCIRDRLFTAFMPNFLFYVVTSIVGGLAWALAGGTLANYLLEKVPDNDRPAYLAWYNIALNSAIFIGVLLGPLLATIFNVQVALVLAFIFRLGGALFIWWSRPPQPGRGALPAAAGRRGWGGFSPPPPVWRYPAGGGGFAWPF